MKKILTILMTLIFSMMNWGITASADDNPTIISVEMLAEQVNIYIEEHALPVLYTSREMHNADVGFLTIVCEKAYRIAIRDELADYIKNTFQYSFPSQVFAVMTEEQLQLEEKLKDFITDRQICALVFLTPVVKDNDNIIAVEFLADGFDSKTEMPRGKQELLAYLDTIHVGVYNDLQNQEYEQQIMVMWQPCSYEVTLPLRGDINNDGNTDMIDAQLVLCNAVELMLDSETVPLAGSDIDKDGEITSSDAQYILIFYVQNNVVQIPTMWKDIIVQ